MEMVIEYLKMAEEKTGKLAQIAKISGPSQSRLTRIKRGGEKPLIHDKCEGIGGNISGFS
jgi:hypothetical protein